MKKIITATLLGGAITIGSMLGAGAANADDAMYRVSTDIQPGDYSYTVVGNGMGSYRLCSDTSCEVGEGLIEIETVDGMGSTGYLTIGSDVKFVKTNDLILTPL